MRYTHPSRNPPARALRGPRFFCTRSGGGSPLRGGERRAARERQKDAELLISLILRCSAVLRSPAEFSRGMGTGTQNRAGTAEGRGGEYWKLFVGEPKYFFVVMSIKYYLCGSITLHLPKGYV